MKTYALKQAEKAFKKSQDDSTGFFEVLMYYWLLVWISGIE